MIIESRLSAVAAWWRAGAERRARQLTAPLAVGVLAAGVGTVGLIPSRQTDTAEPPASLAWSLAKVHVRITTTSDWATLDIGGALPAARKGAGTSGLRVKTTENGWELNGAGTYDADVALGLTPNDLRLAIDKGTSGTATAVVTAPDGEVLATASSTTHLAAGNHPNRQYTSTPRAALTRLEVRPDDQPHGDTRRLTLAFAYPWFGDSYDDRRLTDRPRQPRSWFTSAGVLSMTQQAKANGIDGFVMSFAGEADNGRSLDRLLAAAGQTGSVVAPYLETVNAVDGAGLLGSPRAVVEQWLRDALRRSGDPSFLRLRGVPVVFVYQMQKLSAADWATVRLNLSRSGLPVVLVGDSSTPTYRPLVGGLHSYTAVEDLTSLTDRSQYVSMLQRAASVLDPRAVPGLSIATVSPGYDDRKTRGLTNPVVPRDGGRRYDDTWTAARSGSPDWVVITSWNEWFEGTAVEPGEVSGALALAQTKEQAAAFRAQ